MTEKLFLPAGLKIGSTYLGNVGEQSVEQGLDELTATPAGDWAPNFTGGKLWAPEFQVECHEIAAALALMTNHDLCRTCTADVVKIVARKMTNLGMAADVGDAEHVAYSCTNAALVFWDALQATQGDEGARLTVKAICSDNGVNSPLVMAGSVTIDNPAGQSAPFTLGPVEFNGATLAGVRSMSWQNRCKVLKEGANGSGSPVFVAIQQVAPVIRFETADLDTVAGWYGYGEAVSELNIWLRRRRPNKVNYADADAQHLKIAATAGTLVVRKVSGSPMRAECEVRLERPSPTGELFEVSAGVAIA